MIKVFILAAGASRRCGGQIKQLFLINGEPIIRRIIRQIREVDPNIKIHIITWHNSLKYPDVGIIDTIKKPDELADSILFSVPYWGERNIILVGVAVFSDKVIKNILLYNGKFAIFGTVCCPTKNGSERFAISFLKEESQTVINLLKKSARIFKNSAWEGVAGLQKLCYATHDERLIPFICPYFYHRNEMPLHIRIVRPFRDFLEYHIMYLWIPRRIMKYINIKDPITTDIDSIEEYNKFIASKVV